MDVCDGADERHDPEATGLMRRVREHEEEDEREERLKPVSRGGVALDARRRRFTETRPPGSVRAAR
jgi:hypothetical protein